MTITAPLAPAAGTDTAETFSVSLKLLDGFSFQVSFDGEPLDTLVTDEPSPRGEDRGPAPSRLLAAAVANCLAASLLHCLRKSRVAVEALEATAVATMGRNERGRLRIERIAVLLDPRIAAEDVDRLAQCTTLFQDYCIVTESVRNGIDVRVTVASS